MSALMPSRRERLLQARFYGIFDLAYAKAEEAEAVCGQMLAGGVDIIQLRAKNHPEDQVEAIARKMKPFFSGNSALFIINDYPNVARRVGADGVHIGQEDGTVAAARALLSPGQLVGKSTHSRLQASETALEKPDYIGVGPLYATATKPDYTPVGLELIGQVNAEPNVEDLPCFCIGGVHLERLPEILSAGAERIVIVSAILQSRDITAYCRQVREHLETFAP